MQELLQADQIIMNVIKEIIDLIVQPLTYITNLSLSSGTVPYYYDKLSDAIDQGKVTFGTIY